MPSFIWFEMPLPQGWNQLPHVGLTGDEGFPKREGQRHTTPPVVLPHRPI